MFYFVFEGIFQVQAPGGLIFGGDLTEGFCVNGLGGLYFEGLIHGGAYFRNFTVVLYPSPSPSNCIVISIMPVSFACQSQKQHVSQWKITPLVNKTSLLGSMEMHSYYEEGTCAWPLVFKCIFNMLFHLAFNLTVQM